MTDIVLSAVSVLPPGGYRAEIPDALLALIFAAWHCSNKLLASFIVIFLFAFIYFLLSECPRPPQVNGLWLLLASLTLFAEIFIYIGCQCHTHSSCYRFGLAYICLSWTSVELVRTKAGHMSTLAFLRFYVIASTGIRAVSLVVGRTLCTPAARVRLPG